MLLNTKYTRKKKLRPIRQVLMASPNENTRSAYVFVTNAIIIVPVLIMTSHVATSNNIPVVSLSITSSLSISKYREIIILTYYMNNILKGVGKAL
jgi:hypothetical protein